MALFCIFLIILLLKIHVAKTDVPSNLTPIASGDIVLPTSIELDEISYRHTLFCPIPKLNPHTLLQVCPELFPIFEILLYFTIPPFVFSNQIPAFHSVRLSSQS